MTRKNAAGGIQPNPLKCAECGVQKPLLRPGDTAFLARVRCGRCETANRFARWLEGWLATPNGPRFRGMPPTLSRTQRAALLRLLRTHRSELIRILRELEKKP